ncbi:MAG: NUDIX domain-containing protein [Micropruina sp.]|nr:MAG: NUDIX domain-containing protein [Micropruina sp.]
MTSDEAIARLAEAGRGHYPKVKAYCVLLNAERTHHLVWRGYDPAKAQEFHRLLGGHVEFGEYSRDAVVREIEEELGVHLADPELLGLVENVFDYDNKPGHEVIFVYVADVPDPRPSRPRAVSSTTTGCRWRACGVRWPTRALPAVPGRAGPATAGPRGTP